MAYLNKVYLIGNLTRDPELGQLPSGSSVCNFGMAVNRTITLATGEKRDEVCYVDLVAMGRSAEVIAQYVRKGSPLFVEGRLHFEQWDDRETGRKRSRITVRVERSQFLPSGTSGQQQDTFSNQAPAYRPAASQPQGFSPQTSTGFAGNLPNQGSSAPPVVPPAPSYFNQNPSTSGMPTFKPLSENLQQNQTAPANDTTQYDMSDGSDIEDDVPF